MSGTLHWLTSPAWADVVKALLHTFWQGAAVAALLAVALRRESRPVVRYWFSLAALAATMASGLVTWGVINGSRTATPQISPAAPAAIIAGTTSTLTNSEVTEKAVVVVAARTPHSEAQQEPSAWTAWLALVWIGGAGLMLARAGTQVAGAEKLRCSCQPVADPRLMSFLSEARRAMQLGRQVRIAVTERLTSPAVVGVLVPTLILPLSLLTTLTPEQIRFVLLHELAHVRRGDYLANLFQMFAEALLFFNPAVWWISHQVRREREACCDALAIELSGAPAAYARTLLHVAENILSPLPVAATGFGERRPRSSLTERIQRLLVPGYRPALRLTWRAMLCSLIAGTALLMLSAVGTRITVAAILSPQQRIEQIESKMAEYGQEPEVNDNRVDSTNAPKVQVSGRVRTADGSALPNVRWVNLYYHRKNNSGVSGARLETNGTFSASLSAGQICAGLDVPGFAPYVTKPVDALGTNRLENLDLVLDRGFDTTIVISDSETAEPIPGAKIFAQFWLRTMGIGIGTAQQLNSDQSGKATLPHSPTSVELALVVNAPGYEILEQRIQQLIPQEPIQIKLRRGLAVSGVVLNAADNTPLAGATIRMIHEKGRRDRHYQWTDGARQLGTTDASGKFTLNQLVRGSTYWLGVSAPGHESVIVPRVSPGRDALTVKLGPELVVRGRVLGGLQTLQQINHDRALYQSFTEKIENTGFGDGNWVPVRVTNGVATFQFTNRTAGPVTISGGGYRETRDVAAPVADWVIDLDRLEEKASNLAASMPKREVVFRFIDKSGVPPRGTVTVSTPDNLDPKHLSAHEQEFEIKNGEVHAQIPIGGFTSLSPRQTIGYWFKNISMITVTNGAGPMIVDVPVVPAGAIYATARNVDGTPAGGLFFSVEEVKRSPQRAEGSLLDSGSDGFSDNSPRKWISGALPLGGTYQIIAWRNNSFCASQPIKLTEEKPTAEIELQFKRGQTLEGVVTDAAGKPIPDAEVECSFTLKRDRSFGLKSVFTDSSGHFQLEETTPEMGTYDATAKSPGHRAERVELNAAGRTTIQLKPGLKLSGQVVESGTGYPIPDAEIRAWAQNGDGRWPQQKTRTDADGRFEFDTLADATYTLYVDGANFADTRRRNEFKAGQAAPLKLELTLYPGSSLQPKVPPAPSQTNQNAGSRNTTNEPMDIRAEDSSIDLETGLLTLNNNVVIRSGDQVLKTDSAVIDTRSRQIVSKNAQVTASTQTPYPASSSRRAEQMKRLSTMHLDEVHFDAAPLAEVVRALNIKISKQLAEGAEPTLIGLDPNGAPVNNIRVTINPPLKDVRLVDALEAIVATATSPIHYSVVEFGIFLSPDAPSDLRLRRYTINSSLLLEQLRHFTNMTATPSAVELQWAARGFLASRQINLDPATGRNVFFDSANGTLLVRAATNELDAVERLLFAPQIQVLTRFAEIPEATARELRKRLFAENNSTGMLSTILSPAQSREMLSDLEQQGADKNVRFDVGQVTTSIGRQAQIQWVDLRSIPFTDTNGVIRTKMIPLGPVVDFLPAQVTGRTIELKVIPSYTELLGYDDPGQFIIEAGTNREVVAAASAAIPRFRVRSGTVVTNVPDGHTLVMSGLQDQVLGGLPFGRLSRGEVNTTNRLLVLVTATLIDQSGNRLNPE